ncbi:MAG: hypothetical protein F9K38_00895 [Pseudorhodoplanes sp.]|nr:MAG: hypothetical protein F9K38_00895 [Pseudorhodoplanes sp.]
MQPDVTVVVAKKNRIWFSAAGAFMVAMMVLTILTVAYMAPVPDTRQEYAICDRAFKDFMAAENLVDLERAKFILEKLNCSIAQRLERRARE